MAKKKIATRQLSKNRSSSTTTEQHKHPMAEALLRPDVGTQAQFRKKKPPANRNGAAHEEFFESTRCLTKRYVQTKAAKVKIELIP
jgi:hypothetical protein